MTSKLVLLSGALFQRKTIAEVKTTNPYLHQRETRSTPASEQ